MLQGFKSCFSENSSSWIIFIESSRETAEKNVSHSPQNRNLGLNQVLLFLSFTIIIIRSTRGSSYSSNSGSSSSERSSSNSIGTHFNSDIMSEGRLEKCTEIKRF